jgi:CoA:oxalate CoA-transferase
MPFMGWVAANLLIGHQQPVLLGNDNFTAAPSGTFATRDGYINIAANKQEQWESVVDILGLQELKTDSRFQERDARKKNRKALTPLLEAKLRERETDFWVEILNKNDVPSGKILGLEEALDQEQIKHRNTLQKLRVEGVGDLPFFNLTAQFEKTPGSLDAPPPRLSAHTEEILKSLGYDETQIEDLRQQKVI